MYALYVMRIEMLENEIFISFSQTTKLALMENVVEMKIVRKSIEPN